MNLYKALQIASSEEDVKDAYIKALGLKGYQKNLIDIQTKEIWFEAKDSGRNSTYAMFTQLLHYVQDALNKGEYIPPFLSVIDTNKAAIMRTQEVLPFLKKKNIKWGKSASNYSQEALDAVSAYIGTHIVSFNIKSHEEEYIKTVKDAIKNGEIIRIQITPDNLKLVFDKWVEMVGLEILNVNNDDYHLLFFADIMHDGTITTHQNLPAELLHKNGKPVFEIDDKIYELANIEGYRRFWSIYQKPPKPEYRDYILERRDSLIPIDERIFKGAFYTPLKVVDKAYEKLNETLGKNWQKEYIVWDMCCGVGNLEVKHSNHRNIFMSTLDDEDIDVMKATKTCAAAVRFQYDYLNDDINDDGEIDYNLTNKLPKSLKDAIENKKRILILMNPPYGEATNRAFLGKDITGKENFKTGISKTSFSQTMEKYGKARNELFVQFLARISIEMPNATIAMFSTMKYINASSMQDFRDNWSAKFLDGFVIHNKAFDGLTGKFPIGFLIWKTLNDDIDKTPISSVKVDVLDKNAIPIGDKTFYNLPKMSYLNKWLKRPRSNREEVIPIKNTVSPATAKPSIKTWSDNAIAYMHCNGNDVQQTEQLTSLYSSVFSAAHGFFVNPENLWQSAIIFTVRRIIKQTWLNDRDQFLQPSEDLSEEFKLDCLMWMLFNRCNKTASANDLEWNGKKWKIINHFIPFSEQELNAPERFESDFMFRYTSGKDFSKEAIDVLDEGRKIWQAYFTNTDNYSVRNTLKLNRSDVGWFQVRKAIEFRNNNSEHQPVSFDSFKKAYEILTEKLQPMVYDLGFLKR